MNAEGRCLCSAVTFVAEDVGAGFACLPLLNVSTMDRWTYLFGGSR